jgi:hypothetical protein
MRVIAAVLDGWVYIDGGEFSYSEGSGVTYQYCILLSPLSRLPDTKLDSIDTIIHRPIERLD